MPTEVTESNLFCISFEQLDNTALATATKLNPPSDAEYAELQAVGQNVRIRFDGTAPTTTVGHVIVAGTLGRMVYSQLRDVRVIREADGATLEVSYYRNRRHDD